MKTYRKVSIIFTAAFIILLMNGCQGEPGPQGPSGYDGAANVNTLFYTIYTDDWIAAEQPGLWYDIRTTPYVTQNIIDNGFVLFFVRSADGDDYWQSLPTTEVFTDDSGTTYSIELGSWYGPNTLQVQWRDSHPDDPWEPDRVLEIKAVIVEGVPILEERLMNVDLTDYYAVSEALGIHP